MGEQDETAYKAFNSYEIAEVFIDGLYFGYKLKPGSDRKKSIVQSRYKYKTSIFWKAFLEGADLECNFESHYFGIL